ncbi:MAG: VWA domain-containing protein [Acidobacteria bacterium]|nr:VWA domain-containing protein [Acidobacteriota bacterium]NIM60627.1 VWA domain-containing protein [Acidobacteriota bacterium]NIO57914.1 VWA domain-containing protein [Acidobacteriota bacterium]NIQ28917.1 VWA domain-containing protein [Acidobacteriota bacterium]NIQ83391.1 VWA domain-containing protein [Acidobacteriota bacterium]
MRFAQPEILWLLLGLPLLAVASWISAARRRRALRRFAGGADFVTRFSADISSHRRVAKTLLLQLALLATLLAAARPQWGRLVDEVKQAGVDVVVLMDTSLSMAAEDLAPSRLELARDEIDTLLDSLAGDRVALITFAGVPTLACPLTVDHGAVRLFLDAVEPEVVQVPGTALAEAIELGIDAFGDQELDGVDRSRAMVLFTDGEDHEGGIDEVLSKLKKAGVVVHAIGVGTARGAPIPVPNETAGSGRFKKDADGRLVTTRLDEASLQQLAFETGGHYYTATAGAREVDELIQTIGAMSASEFGATLRTRYRERYQIPLAVALCALIAEALLGDPRRRRVVP